MAIQRELGNSVLQLVDISVYMVVLELHGKKEKAVFVQVMTWKEI